jgi:hypothetical protein
MIAKNKIPDSSEAWLAEIAKAYLDAIETLPFGELVGQEIEPIAITGKKIVDY